MKKFLCFLVVLCSVFVLPFAALGSTTVNHEGIRTVISMVKEGFSSYPNIWCNVTYDYTQNAIILEAATDGFARTAVYICNSEPTPDGDEVWDYMKNSMVDMCNIYISVMKMYDCDNVHFILRIVNDDAYIRNDYSTITYNPILVIEDGVVVHDIVEDMKSN